MHKPTLEGALVAAMVAKHRWGTPIDEDHLIAVSAVATHDYVVVRHVIDDLRHRPFITDHGWQDVELDNGRFDELADFPFRECGWRPTEVEIRLKHYEGWDEHDWFRAGPTVNRR